MLIEILHKQKIHVAFQLDHLAMDKTEYFDINDLLRSLTDKILAFRKTQYTQGLNIFNQTSRNQTCESLSEIYIQMLYITEKYGLVDLATVINTYILTYTSLIDIYNIFYKPEPSILPTVSKELRLSAGTEQFVSPYDSEDAASNYNTDESDELIFDVSEPSSMTSTMPSPNNSHNSTSEYMNTHCFENSLLQNAFTTLTAKVNNWLSDSGSPAVLNKFIDCRVSSHAASAEYLSICNATCRPFQVNAFIQLLGPESTSQPTATMLDMYQQLNMFSKLGIINNARILATNEHISNIYRELLTSKFSNYPSHQSQTTAKGNMYVCDINNKLILSTLPEISEATHGHIAHVMIRIQITKHVNILFILNNYFVNEDNLIIYKYPILSRKLETIKQQIGCLTDITATFKSGISNIITLKQCLCECTADILQWCYSKWELYQLVMAKPIVECMNYFLAQSNDQKANILTTLLLNYTVPDSSYRAFILWDLLVDESINITGNPGLEHGVFLLIKPELQTHLKHILDIQYERTRQITAVINENDLEYERKIMLSLADDSTKARAFEKLREVSNKASDNSSKAQKYLDGLLAIPFGVYSREWIIVKNDQLYATVRTCICNLLAMCYEYKDTYSACGELANWLTSELGIPANIHVINQYISNSKCGAYQLLRISEQITQLTSSRVVISKDHLDYTYIRTILESLDIETISNILNELQTDISLGIPAPNKPKTTLAQIDEYVNNSRYRLEAIACILHVLTEENHFYDVGYPSALLNYQHRLAELLIAWENLKTEKRKFLEDSYARLDASIYGQAEAKDQLIRIIAQWINGNQSGYCLGFEGSPGLGKTSLAKYGISQALADKDGKSRPFGFIALGGSSNGSILEGHGYTYVGSTWGRIADILMQSKCMNPIIFVDELDKISTTENGRELIGILTHLTDRTQNNEFMDKYFDGVRLDLSRVLFIFSYNDFDRLDSILADRIHRIRFENYTVDDKVVIARDYLVPKIRDEINILGVDYIITPETIRYMVDAYTYEAGVRKLKEKLYDLYRELNVRDIKGSSHALATHIPNQNGKIEIKPEMVDDILSTYHKVEHELPYPEPRIGIVYGLFATGMGIGGITIIQVARKRVDAGSSLICTGKQGEVMMESMKVALTLACNLVPQRYLEEFGICESNASVAKCKDCNKPATQPSTEKYAFHIHCPDGATPKDGPSAGCAFTLGLVSQLTRIPVRNDVTMTGEVDIMGNVLPIGGLDSKILGSKRAGIRHVLVPEKNRKDIERIRMKTPSILADMTISYVSAIDTVLEQGLSLKIEK
jgi:endopeptidase La